ncbi:MAG: hypothetical protein FJ319_12905 [SAR202 cluster bacterium]|nr:hypothetical protein [SAR202 cluster bacterium]
MTLKRDHKAAWYPRDHVMAVIDDREDAAEAIQALRDEGFHTADIKRFTGDQVEKQLKSECDHCGFMERFARTLWKYFALEGAIFDDYKTEGRAGHIVLAVHAETQ